LDGSDREVSNLFWTIVEFDIAKPSACSEKPVFVA